MKKWGFCLVLVVALLLLELATPLTAATSVPNVAQHQPSIIGYARYNISEYRLLIMVLDAVRYDCVTPDYMPFVVGSLKPHSLWLWSYTLLKPGTRQFRALFSSGAVPWVTGIDTRDRTSVWTGLKTIVDAVHDMGYTTVAVIDVGGYAFFTSEADSRWTTGYKASWSDYVVLEGHDPSIDVDNAIQMMDAHPNWKLMWIEFHHPDKVGHEYTWDSSNYVQAVRDTDEGVRQVYEELERRGILNETVILIVTDHGGHGTVHGDLVELTMRVWGLIHVPDEAIIGEYEFSSMTDLVTTVAYLMGIPLSEYSTGVTLVGGAKPHYMALNLLGTSPPNTTPVTLPNGTVVEADHFIVSNGYYTLLLTLLNDTTYVHNLGAITFATLTAAPSSGYQFMEVAVANPTRSDLMNLNLSDRLNTLYMSPTTYCPTAFVLFNDPGDLSGNGRTITGSDFGDGVENPSNDLVEREMTIEEHGGVVALRYHAKMADANFSGSLPIETHINIYIPPNVPFTIYEVNITNLGSTDIVGYHPGIRTEVQPALHSNATVFLNESGDIVYEDVVSSATNFDGYRGCIVVYKDDIVGHERLVRGFFLLEYDGGTPRFRVGGATFNAMLANVTISPGQSFRFVVADFTGLGKEDAPKVARLAKYVWSVIEGHGLSTLGKMFVKASPMIAVRYGNESAYPIHSISDWEYDPTTMTARAVVYAPTGSWSTIEIRAPPKAKAVERIDCNATSFTWFFDKAKGVVVVKALHSSAVEVSATFTNETPPVAGVLHVVPITITEHSGQDLVDYQVEIELNSTNFDGWDKVLYEDGRDIYFLSESKEPLYYWIDYFNRTEQKAVIFVKVPSIPANGETTIYMYLGGDNPYSSYRDPSQVFDFYDDFDTDTWVHRGASTITIANGTARIVPTTTAGEAEKSLPAGIDPTKMIVEFSWKILVAPSGSLSNQRIGVLQGTWSDWNSETAFGLQLALSGTREWRLFKRSGGTLKTGTSYTMNLDEWYLHRLKYSGSGVRLEIYNEGYSLVHVDSLPIGITPEKLYMATSEKSGSDSLVDWIRVRKYVSPEPGISIGGCTPVAKGLTLPSESLFLEHRVTYSPNSTQFSHSFTATNTTTAGYEVNYTSPYGWRIYTNPYEVNGAYYENNASLVSEVNVTLPYSEVLVENVTLLAKTNGTGSYRQLWVKVLDSAGNVVAELTNATLGTDWTEVALAVNASLSGQATIWINATVASTNATGEEIAVGGVRLSARYEANPTVTVSVQPNVEYFNCSAQHSVELGSSEYLNSSSITFKLIEHLIYGSADYPTQPVYVGSETIGSYSYSVYKIEPANYSQTMTIYALLENKLKALRTHVRGYDTETVLVGETLTVELPDIGNVTIPELNVTFTNASTVVLKPASPGTYTINASMTLAPLWKLGYWVKTITAKYGAFSARALDLDSKEVDYEELTLQLVNKTDGSVIKELTGNKLFSLTDLWAGNYTLVAKFKDLTVGTGGFELNITTDGSTVDLACTMKSLATDYRGFSRSLVTSYDKQLLGVESLSDKFPFSRMRVLLNGSGSFKLYVNYRGDLPTKVSVAGNVSNPKYWWDGYYLVVTGSLGSVGELNVTDLYKLRVEIYDRLNNTMPSWIYAYINGTKYSGAVVENHFHPEDYVVELPTVINGFDFYGFWDGFNESTRIVTVNHSDVIMKAWYRVPTGFAEVGGYQVSSLWRLPFIRQDEEMARVYIKGYLKDYYGSGVPDRQVAVRITDVEADHTWLFYVVTDASGYFRTPLIDLIRGKTYEVEVSFGGDDIYVESTATTEIKPEELPTAPIAFEVPTPYILVAVGIALVVVGVIATIKSAKHTIEDLRERNRRFVRRKRR